ncbi:L-threonylcarbamoyladenylate synthase [Salinispora arenicola]|uniref:L-threonylcarbamoyladenylate synthase n=1 Tax=Salinispora arenicola TaxID=168697 RepID=A0A542XN68_SALAC|nr:L-threonylcarbamoyladenylate synthase [Salinispora arenicola]MCN0155201.1 L-threonylcarbamoyladenylate synthase [Salinispora arenicola]TQL37309.1 translation factor SUA5 [Salinispora arenicola]GIM87457.1 putative threonylcarbamoyl-AMP synthase [Salinispora arenicola]
MLRVRPPGYGRYTACTGRGRLLLVMLYDCRSPADRDRGVAAAIEAVRGGELVVLPTDTVYGVGADAFTPHAVKALLDAKGGRPVPPPVLIGSRRTLDGLVFRLPRAARDLVEAFWPGALTIVVEHSPSLRWDLGETSGTVAVRMPLHPVALEVLRETGPMAVASANTAGLPAATTAEAARGQLAYSVRTYLEAGPAVDPVPSTIVDLTGAVPQLVRAGAVGLDRLRDVVPDIVESRAA